MSIYAYPNTVESFTPLAYTSSVGASEYRERALACRGYLLDAGCDPTTPEYWHYRGGMLGATGIDSFAFSFFEGDIVRRPYTDTISCSALNIVILGRYDDNAG